MEAKFPDLLLKDVNNLSKVFSEDIPFGDI
jgi:hypothetical protein